MKYEELNEQKHNIICVYKWENLINHKIYIGQTTNLFQRYKCLKSNSIRPKMKSDIEKYGIENFELTILESGDFTKEELIEKEAYYIKLFNSSDSDYGYNICKKSSAQPKELNGMYGRHHTEESKEKFRRYLHRCWSDEDYKKKQSERMSGENNIMYGVHLYGELNGMYGKHHTEESKEKIRNKLKGRKLEKNCKKVRCVETNQVFNSLTDAAAYFNISLSGISGVLNGRHKTHCGYHWEYVKND